MYYFSLEYPNYELVVSTAPFLLVPEADIALNPRFGGLGRVLLLQLSSVALYFRYPTKQHSNESNGHVDNVKIDKPHWVKYLWCSLPGM